MTIKRNLQRRSGVKNVLIEQGDSLYRMPNKWSYTSLNNYETGCYLPAGCLAAFLVLRVGRDCSVGIATCYGLDGPGMIESRWGRDFPYPSRRVLRPTQTLIQWVPGLLAGSKAAGRGVDHPHPSSAEVKERVELYHYSPSVSSWLVLGRTLPFTLSGSTYVG